jgi:hypothetical protein
MVLTPERRTVREGFTDQEIRARLAAGAGPGTGSVVRGLGDGMILRGDVEDFLRERQEKAAEAQKQREKKTDTAQRRRDILQGVSIGVALTALVWAIVSFLLKP